MPEQTQKKPNVFLIVLAALIVVGVTRIITGVLFSGPVIETYCYRINLPKSWDGDYTVSSCEDWIGANYTEAGCITVVTRTSTGERFVVGIFSDNWTMDEWIARDYDDWVEEVDLSWATPETTFDTAVVGRYMYDDWLVTVGAWTARAAATTCVGCTPNSMNKAAGFCPRAV